MRSSGERALILYLDISRALGARYAIIITIMIERSVIIIIIRRLRISYIINYVLTLLIRTAALRLSLYSEACNSDCNI